MSFDAPLIADGADEAVHFDVADTEPSPEARLLDGSLSEDLQKVMDQLSEEQRLLVILADVEQLPYKDIAELMGKPVGTIRSRLHRAHKQMRQKLDRIRESKSAGCKCGMGLCLNPGAC
jgi:RNA polymerase sigma-70 factor (ECF subfamily)